VLKKVGVVAAAAIGLSLIATPAMASASPAHMGDLPGLVVDRILVQGDRRETDHLRPERVQATAWVVAEVPQRQHRPHHARHRGLP
jgi:hypothetical protein